MKDKTLVLGASENPARYSNLAIKKLIAHNKDVVAIGNRKGTVEGVPIGTETTPREDIDTVTLYLNPRHQLPYYDFILSLRPRRIIFNPGAENDELAERAEKAGVITLEGCTLVMLSTGQY